MERNTKGQFLKDPNKLTDSQRRQRWFDKAKQTPAGRAKILTTKAKARAIEKNVPYSLTEKWVANKIRRGFCEATGIPFVLDGASKHKYAPSLDRIDPKRGYVPSNVRVTIWRFNESRMDSPDHEFLDLCFKFIKFARDQYE